MVHNIDGTGYRWRTVAFLVMFVILAFLDHFWLFCKWSFTDSKRLLVFGTLTIVYCSEWGQINWLFPVTTDSSTFQTLNKILNTVTGSFIIQQWVTMPKAAMLRLKTQRSHESFVNILLYSFGICLQWILSYLHGGVSALLCFILYWRGNS